MIFFDIPPPRPPSPGERRATAFVIGFVLAILLKMLANAWEYGLPLPPPGW